MYSQQRSAYDPDADVTTYVSVVFNQTGINFAKTASDGATLDDIAFNKAEANAIVSMILSAIERQRVEELYR